MNWLLRALRITPITLTAVIALVCAFHVQAEPVQWPKLATDDDIVNFLAAVEDRIPGLFDNLVEYETDLIDVIKHQQALSHELALQPALNSQLTTRPDRHSILITYSKKILAEAPKANPESLAALKKELMDTFAHIDPKIPVREAIVSSIKNQQSTWSGLNLNGFMTGLIKSLPQGEQGPVFAAPISRKLELLSQKLTDEAIRAGLKVQHPNIDLANLTAQRAVQIARELVARDLQIEKLSVLAGVLDFSKGLSREEAEGMLARLDATQIASAVQPGEIQKRVSAVVSEGSAIKQATDFAQKRIRPILMNEPAMPPKASLLKLVEVPPQLGIFRGCVGSECSTKNSFAYANSPYERTWFIEGEKGELRGYLTATQLKAGGKPSLYVNSLNGTRLTLEQSQAILSALYESKGKLGVEQIVLPVHERLLLQFNSMEIRNWIDASIQGKNGIPLEFTDSDLRHSFARFVKRSDYDSPEANTNGIAFMPSGELETRVEVKPSDPFKLDVHPIDRGRALIISLELDQSGRAENARAIRHAGGIAEADYAAIRAILANSERQPTEQYIEKAKSVLAEYGIPVDSKLKQVRQGPFCAGLIRASDAFQPQYLDRTANAFVTLLDHKAEWPELARVAFRHKAELARNEKLSTYLNKLARLEDGRGLEAIWERFALLSSNGLDLEAFPLLRDKLLAITREANYLGHDYYRKLGSSGILATDKRHAEIAIREFKLLEEQSRGADTRIPKALAIAQGALRKRCLNHAIAALPKGLDR